MYQLYIYGSSNQLDKLLPTEEKVDNFSPSVNELFMFDRSNVLHVKEIVPGQCCVLQLSVWLMFPGQYRPCWVWSGQVHVRLRSLVPDPQVAVQADQDSQDDHLPSADNHINHIRKTCLGNVYPLIPHFYTAKLGFTGVLLFFLFLFQNIDCVYEYH